MPTAYRVSRKRQVRKAIVQLLGRRPRAQSCLPKLPAARKYRRPDALERYAYHQYADQGWSQRHIARTFHRDHHAITRALTYAGRVKLARDLAAGGHVRLASSVAATLAPDDRKRADTLIRQAQEKADVENARLEARWILLMGAPTLARRVVEEADVDQAIEVLRDPTIGVLTPVMLPLGLNVQCSVSYLTCGACARPLAEVGERFSSDK